MIKQPRIAIALVIMYFLGTHTPVDLGNVGHILYLMLCCVVAVIAGIPSYRLMVKGD